MFRPARLSFPLALLLAIGCSDSRGPMDPITPPPDPAFGRLAFEASCSGCHASRDGFDLSTFGFSDTTIIRRAVKHVDSSTARSIVAYIRSLSTPRNEEDLRLFQPRGAPIASDVDFAIALFGRDAWPAEVTTASLASIDPRTVQVSIKMPKWSDEGANTDWMPDFPLSEAVLSYSGGLAAGAIAGYRAAPTKENLIRAVTALRTADRAVANPGAPCLLDDTVRVRYRECFEVRRWTSTLVAIHMLKNGTNQSLGDQVHDIWWDVGNAARRSRADKSVPIANVIDNWASWMFLGWSFNPALHSTSYTGGAFRQLNLNRQATFVALRSEVARPKNSASVYEDVMNAVRFSPAAWTSSVAKFGLRHLSERLAVGDKPTNVAQLAMAVTQVTTAINEAKAKVPVADRAQIDAMGQQVLAALR